MPLTLCKACVLVRYRSRTGENSDRFRLTGGASFDQLSEMHIQPLVAVAALLVGAVAGDMPVMIPEASADSYRAAGTRPHPQRADLWEEWRLPQHMRPVSYTVRLLPFIEEGNFLTLGAVEIYVDCLQDAGNVTLHSAVNLNESSVAVRPFDGRLGSADRRRSRC